MTSVAAATLSYLSGDRSLTAVLVGVFQDELEDRHSPLGVGVYVCAGPLLHPGEWAVVGNIFTGFLNYINAPGPCPGAEGEAMAVGARLCACLARRARSTWQVPSYLYSTVNGAAGHNRGGVVERRLLARTRQDR